LVCGFNFFRGFGGCFSHVIHLGKKW
jgi:hypothetical protein